MTSIELLEKAQSLLSECNDIVHLLEGWKTCNPTLKVDGLQKMTSTLLAEQKFLEKVRNGINMNGSVMQQVTEHCSPHRIKGRSYTCRGYQGRPDHLLQRALPQVTGRRTC